MPRIPTSNRRQVFEQVSSGQGFKARLGDTTQKSNLLASVAETAGGIAQAYERETIKAEQTQLDEYKTKLRNKKIELVHDKDKGFLRERGKNAAANEKKYTDEFTKYHSDLMGKEYGGASERLKAQMIGANENFATDLKGIYSQHTSRQNEIYEDDSFKSNVESLHSEALLDKTKIKTNLIEQARAIDSYADRKGLGKEQKEMMHLKASTQLHSAVIKDFVSNDNDQMAKDYYKQALSRGEIDGATADHLEKVIESAGITGESQRMTDSIMSNTELNSSQKLAEARKLGDKASPKVRDELVRRVKNRINEDNQIKKQMEKETYESMADVLERDKNLNSIPPHELTALPNNLTQALKRREAQLAKGEEPKTDLERYYKLEQLSAENPTAFASMNLMKERAYFSDRDFMKMSSLQKNLKKKKGGEEGLAAGIQSKVSIINTSLSEMGIKYSGRDAKKEDIGKANLFRRKVDDIVVERQLELGRKVNSKEVREIVEDLRVEIVTEKGFFWDDKKLAFEVTDEDKIAIDFESIPRDQVTRIKRVLKIRGEETSEENITRLYAAKLEKRLGKNGI